MVTLYGISNFTAVEYSDGTSIEHIASENEYIIKRIKCNNTGGNWHYDYIILNKQLELCKIEKNGWKTGKFHSYSAWNPKEIPIDFIDPQGKKRDIPFKRKTSQGTSINILSVVGLGTSAINSFIECFLEASTYRNWLDYLKSYPDITIDENYLNSISEKIEIKDNSEHLKREIYRLQTENNELNKKIDEIKHIVF